MTKAAEGGQGLRSHFICLKKVPMSFNKLCQLSLETIFFEEVMITFAEMYTKAMNLCVDVLFQELNNQLNDLIVVLTKVLQWRLLCQ